MNWQEVLQEWSSSAKLNELKEAVENNKNPLVYGAESSQKVFLLAGLKYFLERPFFIVTPDQARAEKLYEDLLTFFPAEKVWLLPVRDYFYTEDFLAQSKEILEQRLAVLSRIRAAEKDIFIIPVPAFLSVMMPSKIWDQHSLSIKKGDILEPHRVAEQLVKQGYERVPLIEGKGQFSVRGEIIDIYPYNYKHPLRLNYFDDQIESLRVFDLSSQRSLYSLEGAFIPPAQEVILPEEVKVDGAKAIRAEIEKAKLAKKEENFLSRLKTRAQNLLARLEGCNYFAGAEHYLSYFYPESSSLVDYLPQEGIVVFDSVRQLTESAKSWIQELKDHQNSLLLRGDLLPAQSQRVWSLEELYAQLKQRLLAFSLLAGEKSFYRSRSRFSFKFQSIPSFQGKWDLFRNELKQWYEEGYRLLFLAHSEERAEQMVAHFREMDITAIHKQEGLVEKCLQVMKGSLENGFLLPELKLGIINEQELLPQRRKRRRLAQKDSQSLLRSYQDLTPGDYVVHEQHGIGRYLGLRTLEVGNVTRDYLHIKYAGEDKLFIPVDQIQLIQKYVGVEGKAPKLHSLGGQEWNRVKCKVKASVQELARELLALYAARESMEGYAFSKDHAWQSEFEMRFPYEETPDQLRAIKEVKADMEKRKTMDRLLCGDVGYGKTEVALRAAFKAVLDGKQVAFLVPTTILAQQHYRNFKERFEGFPVRIDLLSRFRSPAAQKETLQSLKQGKVDIIIGTHRLLSKDVRFKDLGLLIIDEEQRFGVRHKEKLKRLRLDVDVLTMTATPIPRTLHLSLAGARDLSVIETPPENRYPVQTYVVDYSENIVREAIMRELNRKGQVYFVYNRVQGIERWVERLQKLIPGVRVVVAHGQMPERELEKVMNDFLEKKYDVLVSTTIVEAGLDIPNVNTMLIYDADRFGLSQLYQLRGRVGRSNRVAYCYLMYRQEKMLSEAAIKRLRAIKEFTELGSGFKIALRDLEIRGAGNILGPEQHGFMAAVGFDLYCQLLEQAISTLKGERKKKPEREDLKVELNVNAFIPASYIPNQQQKIEFYQRIAACEKTEELAMIEEELKDRFGTLPEPVVNLLAVARLKFFVRTIHVKAIKQEKNHVLVQFREEQLFDSDSLWQLTRTYRGTLGIQARKGINLKLKTNNIPAGKLINSVEELLFAVAESCQLKESLA
ncbi:MAG: transcription-repair coupling factor [Dethiobacteria bacterium]|nr:transcription-repair coupling factor [Bacillota bacterium]